MSLKTYSCRLYPNLVVAGVCNFRDGIFSTDDAVTQARLEDTVSFKHKLVTLLDDEGEETRELPSKTAVLRMGKSDLVELGKAFNVNVSAEMLKNEVLEEVLTLYKE